MNNNKMTVKKIADALAIALIVIILLALFGITGLFSQLKSLLNSENPGTQISTFDATRFYDLEIDAGTATITLIKGDSFTVEGERLNFKIKEKKDKISIEERGGIFAIGRSNELKITVPEGYLFNKVEIESGSSAITGEILRASELELDVGSGNVEFENIEITDKASIDCGAGELSLDNGTINNLKVSLGVGSTDISCTLTSSSEFDCGVGELRLNLPDGKDNYTFDIATGIGAISLDSQRIKNGSTIGNGNSFVKIDGGIGAIDITFNK